MEKILKIEEYDNDSMSGFSIATNKQSINLLISSDQSCCEHWGYFMSNDNLADFLGAELLAISLTDTALNQQKLNDENTYDGNLMFVNLETSKGTLQFVAYNCHNGYYGHEARVESHSLNHSEVL